MSETSRRLGKYELVRRLGVGGTAEVYEALLRGAEGFQKRLALKILLPDLQREKLVVDMFIDEATIVAGLDHPNIIEVFDFGEIEGTHYLAMEYIDGWTLRQVQQDLDARGLPFPLGAAAFCMREVCRALDYVHNAERPIVHRDVTPHNVFITRRGQVKLGDFGIAKAQARRSRTASGQIKGKLSYLAPEQITGEAVTGRTDVYAAGLILFELITGRQLIDGEREVDLLRAAIKPTLIRPSSLRPGATALDPIVLRALQRHPTLRYPNAALLAADLEASGGADKGPGELLALLEQPGAAGTSFSAGTLGRGAAGRPGRGLMRLPSVGSASPGTLPLAAEQRPVVDPAPAPVPATATATVTVTVTEGGLGAGSSRSWWLASAALLLLGLGLGAWALFADGGSRSSRSLDVDASVSLAARPAPRPPAKTPVAAVPDAARPAERPADTRVDATARPPARSRRRRRPRPRPRARPKPPEVETPAVPPPPAIDRQARQQRLATALENARRRGLYPGDDPGFDRRLRRARQQLMTAEGEAALQALTSWVEGFRIDRGFAERKLARLNRTIASGRLPPAERQQLDRLSQRILQLIIGGQLVEASRKMTQALARLQ